MRQPRFLLYAVNGLGLGHVTRLLGLARALRRRLPRAEILFITASEASHLIYREGFAAVKVPSRTAAREGGLRRDSWLRVSQSIVWNTLTSFDPHCLMVDTFAAGAMGELLPVLNWPLRKVFIFRAQRLERAQETSFQNVLRHYDLILVPHAKGDEEVPVPEEVPHVWTGPMLLRDRDELLSREAARAALGLTGQGNVGLISLGGGGDPDIEMARQILASSITELNGKLNGKASWVELSGPLSRETPMAAAMPWTTFRDVYPQMLYLNAFDFAVAATGYNTTHELMAAGVPSMLWPFPRDVDDQGARARRLAEMGQVLTLEEGVGTVVAPVEGSDEVGQENNVASADLIGKSVEINQALSQLLHPTVRERLRGAMRTQWEMLSGRLNGTHVGAQAICRMLGIDEADMLAQHAVPKQDG